MHPLAGLRHRIYRAEKQINALEGASRRFFEEHPYRIIADEFNSQASRYALRVEGGVELPVPFGITVGEIVHNLRAALDGLICQLLLLPAGGDADVICTESGFPIRILQPDAKRVGRRRPFAWKSPLIAGLPQPLKARIEGLQPYRRGNGGQFGPLWSLEELNNSDKHRVIPVIGTRSGAMALTPPPGITLRHIRLKIGVPLKPHAKVGHIGGPLPERILRDMHMYVGVAPQIAFGGSQRTIRRRPVTQTLRSVGNEVRKIVDLFAGEFP